MPKDEYIYCPNNNLKVMRGNATYEKRGGFEFESLCVCGYIWHLWPQVIHLD